ncbi:MAG: putative lipid II flippase FtsW [Nitriliruptorales bacterium]|nr:putative lipid II flippase FtsW [Nitriliruptorales bacterium]
MSAGQGDARLNWSELGTAMSRRLRGIRLQGWNTDTVVLTSIVAILVATGLVMSFSASFVDAAESGDPFGVFRRQLVWATVGMVAFVLVGRLPHQLWRPVSWGLFAAALVGLVAVLLPGVGLDAYGSTRWLAIGPVVVQPSELAKLGLLLWLADVLERKRPRDGSLQDTTHLLVPALPAYLLTAVLVMLEPDLGTTAILALIVGFVLFAEGLPLRHFASLLAAGAVAGVGLAVAAPYRLQRLTGWLDPDADPERSGWQLLQSLYALGSGGWFGLGLGSSRGKWNFIPNPETDFIFAIIGEELGLLGSLAVVTLFLALLIVGMRIARGAPDGFGRTVAFAVTGWIVAQALINVGTVTGLLPVTGVTLPLVSVGGSSLVSTLVALGILVAIARSSATGQESA